MLLVIDLEVFEFPIFFGVIGQAYTKGPSLKNTGSRHAPARATAGARSTRQRSARRCLGLKG